MLLLPSAKSSPSWRTILGRFEKPLTGLLLTLGLATVGLPYISASNAASPINLLSESSVAETLMAESTPAQPLADGVYLYGQSPERDQMGSAYLVIEVTQGDVIGAFYMPRSSFDCVYGNLQAEQLALTVVESYSRQSYPYAIALQSTSNVASAPGGSLPPMTLEGMHRIDNVNSNDQRILATCKADHQEQI
ncbi:MAG: hypothetical protein MUF49_08140 [Oculatellaceae cyanobacterium Prado106]|nr:hypothetical protein [Oculatellaceae cyanobacterium Prado106]